MRKRKKKKQIAVLLTIGLFLALIACGKKETIHIASKPMTEQYILTEMMKQLIERNTNYRVEITKGVGGGTTNIHPAMIKGEFDLYPEYTRTAWLNVLKQTEMEKDDIKLFEKLQAEYNKQGLQWVGLYGFSNTYGLAVSRETAEKYQLATYSDLAEASGGLIFGGNPDYIELATGYGRLCTEYNMHFAGIKQMEIALKYEALNNKEVDVINAFTTDAQLAANDLILLEDDKDFFESYQAGTVVRLAALEKFPELESVLEMMDGLITEDEMQQMNFEVEVNERDEAEVAAEFLKSKGML